MKKLLIPVDFSEKSEFATHLAAKINKKIACEVHLLHLVELPANVVDMVSGSSNSIPERMLYLRKIRDRLLEYIRNHFPEDNSVHYSIRVKNPYEGIIEYSKKINADLIIMGSKGISDFDEILIGSNTEKVVRTSEIPVLVVKKSVEKFKLKNVVFASNFKNDNKEAFKKFLEFAKEFKSKINLLKINTPSKFESSTKTKQEIKEFLSDFDLPKHSIHVYSDTSVQNGVLNFCKETKADLIAITTHGRSGLSQFFNGSVSKSITKNATRPIITFKI